MGEIHFKYNRKAGNSGKKITTKHKIVATTATFLFTISLSPHNVVISKKEKTNICIVFIDICIYK